MNKLLAILSKDLKSYFSSIIAYVIIAIFLIVSGFFFFNMLSYFSLLSVQVTQQPQFQGALNLTDFLVKPLFMNICVLLLFMIPMITMRSFSEEKKNGTVELMFTYPITDIQIVLGKFFALALLLLVFLLPVLCYPLIVHLVGGVVQLKTYFVAMLGLYLLGCSFLSLGVFVSSLTENQIVAVCISFGALILFWVLGWSSSLAPEGLAPFIDNLSIIGHYKNFAQGLIDTQDILFYVLFIVFFLYFTLRILESRNWRG